MAQIFCGYSVLLYNIVHIILMLVVSVPFPKLNLMKVIALSDATVI